MVTWPELSDFSPPPVGSDARPHVEDCVRKILQQKHNWEQFTWLGFLHIPKLTDQSMCVAEHGLIYLSAT